MNLTLQGNRKRMNGSIGQSPSNLRPSTAYQLKGAQSSKRQPRGGRTLISANQQRSVIHQEESNPRVLGSVQTGRVEGRSRSKKQVNNFFKGNNEDVISKYGIDSRQTSSMMNKRPQTSSDR